MPTESQKVFTLLVDGKNLIQEPSGIGRYIEFMINSLTNGPFRILLAVPGIIDAGYNISPGIKVVTKQSLLIPIFLRWNLFDLPKLIADHNVDVIWGPAHRLPLNLNRQIHCILTIHDMVWKKHSNSMRWRGLAAEWLLMPLALRRADKIVCVSHSTQRDVLSYDHTLAEKSVVIPCGGAALKKNSQEPISNLDGKHFILFVGTVEPRKNIDRLCKAFLSLSSEKKKLYKLVIAGRQGWNNVKVPISDNILFVENPSSGQLNWLYKNCLFFAFPSLYEGFGIPLREAQLFGKSLLTSNCSSMPEVAGDSALYIDPKDVDAIKAGMVRLIDDKNLRKTLEKKSVNFAQSFSWDKAAYQLNQAILSLVLRG